MRGVKRVAKATDVELGVARSRPRYLEEAVCVVSRHEFYRVRSIVEGWSILKDALSSPDQQGTLLWADGVYCMTSTASSIDHVGAVRAYPDAVELLTKALDIAISNGDKSLAVKICATLTGRAISTHDYDKVTYWSQRAFEESQGCTDPLALAIAHGVYATTLQGQEKKDHFETSLQYYKESGNVMAIARGLVNISNSLRTEDEDVPERSSTLLKEAHRLANSIGDALYQEHVSRGATMSRNDAVVLSRQPTAAA